MDESNASTGIISDVCACPQCGLPAQLDEYYIIGEERIVCEWCGYTHTKSHQGTEASKGYGSIHYMSTKEEEVEITIPLKYPMLLTERHQIIMLIENCYDKDKSFFCVWDDEANQLDFLIGKKPQTTNEYYEQKALEVQRQWLMEDKFSLSNYSDNLND